MRWAAAAAAAVWDDRLLPCDDDVVPDDDEGEEDDDDEEEEEDEGDEYEGDDDDDEEDEDDDGADEDEDGAVTVGFTAGVVAAGGEVATGAGSGAGPLSARHAGARASAPTVTTITVRAVRELRPSAIPRTTRSPSVPVDLMVAQVSLDRYLVSRSRPPAPRRSRGT